MTYLFQVRTKYSRAKKQLSDYWYISALHLSAN